MKMKKIILGTSLFIAAGANYSTTYAMEGERNDQSYHSDWQVIGRSDCDVTLPGISTSVFQFQYSVKVFPQDTHVDNPQPSCSILMTNGAQIDFCPGLAAIWLTRDRGIKSSSLFTGTFNGKDLYSYSTEEFSAILMNANFFHGAHPILVTFSDDGSFPIQHPANIRTDVIQNWLAKR